MTSPTISIEFYNATATKLLLWIELCCDEIELTPDTEYQLESPETEYRLEIRDEMIVLYYQYLFGPKILKRPYNEDFMKRGDWELVVDNSTI